jgi:DNA helicase IV
VVDEAQDLSPMQLRMLTRRSLNGSMTIVGDIAQSTGAWPHQSWDEVLEHLPDRRPTQRRELTVGYRIPAPLMELAAGILPLAAPELAAPVSVRGDGESPTVLRSATTGELLSHMTSAVRAEMDRGESGNIAVIVTESLVDSIENALLAAGISAGRAPRDNLDSTVTIVPVRLVKGLEVDVSIIVDPGRIVEENPQGYRSLYVAMTRATQRMTVVVASAALPPPLSELLARFG